MANITNMPKKYDKELKGQSPTQIAIEAGVSRRAVYDYAEMIRQGREEGPGRFVSEKIIRAIEELKNEQNEN